MNSIEKAKEALKAWRDECELAVGMVNIYGKGLFFTESQLVRIGEALEALASLPTGEPVAWMTEDGRVASDRTKQNMPNASKAVFTIPCFAAPVDRDSVIEECKRAIIDRAVFDEIFVDNALHALDALKSATTVSQGDKLDAVRLDWLDAVNRRMNERNGTVYGWKFDINHNRAALTDHNFPALSVRAAIDQAIREGK